MALLRLVSVACVCAAVFWAAQFAVHSAHAQNEGFVESPTDLQPDMNPVPYPIPIPKAAEPFAPLDTFNPDLIPQSGSEDDAAPNADTPDIFINLPKIESLDDLPEPVRDLRTKLMAAARTGDVEALRPFIDIGPNGTQLSIESDFDDPIQYLKDSSSDGNALETLAILLDLFLTPPVHFDAGSQDEAYVWPYFWGRSLDELTAAERVELFQIITHGDFVVMEETNTYLFFRVGISPDGKLLFFVTGD